MTDPAVAAAIHERTALYTAAAEIERLLDAVDWPACGGRLLDPGAGDGGIVLAALSRLSPAIDDAQAVADRLVAYEFHAPAAELARRGVVDHLRGRGWDVREAIAAAAAVVRQDDFLAASAERIGRVDLVVANPPYAIRRRLPEAYCAVLEAGVPREARADLLHAHLWRATEVLRPGGRMALVTSDRWLVNRNAQELRRRLGATLGVVDARRLDSASAFHRAKTRRRGTPPRVHAVALTLGPGGRALGTAPFRIEDHPVVAGVPLADVVDLRLAPWLGPDGIFTVDDPSLLPHARLVPCVEPRDVDPRTGAIAPTRRWAIVTDREKPHASVVEHLATRMDAMPQRGRRDIPWLPPERFAHHLPLPWDAVMVPRIAPRLRAVPLPANHLPTGHSLVVASGMPPDRIVRILEDERVQAQADALALRIEGGFRSYTASLLRGIVVPEDLLAA